MSRENRSPPDLAAAVSGPTATASRRGCCASFDRVADDHADRIESAFSLQAPAFEDVRLNATFANDVEWIFHRLELRPDQLLLDVAAGTGHAARALAPGVRVAVAVDATQAMLEAGKRAVDRGGPANVVFVRGDAAALPFPDASFDVVVCRFAAHHFEQPEKPLREMVRCLRPGGQLVAADLVADEDPAVAARQDALERLRDPSHATLLTAGGLAELVRAAGAEPTETATHQTERPLAPWLEQTEAGEAAEAEVRTALWVEIEGGRVTGFAPVERDGELWFTQRFASVTATKRG